MTWKRFDMKREKFQPKTKESHGLFTSTVPLCVLCLSRVAVFFWKTKDCTNHFGLFSLLKDWTYFSSHWLAFCAESLIMINQWNPCICMEYSYWYYLLWHECTHLPGWTKKETWACTKVREEPNYFKYIWVTLTTANYISSEHFLHKFLLHFLK